MNTRATRTARIFFRILRADPRNTTTPAVVAAIVAATDKKDDDNDKRSRISESQHPLEAEEDYLSIRSLPGFGIVGLPSLG